MLRFVLLSLILLPAALACWQQAIKAGKTGTLYIHFSNDKFLRDENTKLFSLLRRVLFISGLVLLLAWLQLAWNVFA